MVASSACVFDDPPETRELNWQVGVGFPEAKWIFPAANGVVCAANDAKFTLDGSRIGGGYVYCSRGTPSAWEPVVPDDGTTLLGYPSLAGLWAFVRSSPALGPTSAFQLGAKGPTTLAVPQTGMVSYTATGKQVVNSASSWKLVDADGNSTPLAVLAGESFVSVGRNDEVIFGNAATGWFAVEETGRMQVLAANADTLEFIGQASDGTMYAATLAANGVMTFWRAAKGTITKIDAPPYLLDHRHHQQCAVTRDGTLFCLMAFQESFNDETGDGWLAHAELLKLSGTTWQRLGLGPPASSGVQNAFVLAADANGNVFAKDTAQFGAVYGLRY